MKVQKIEATVRKTIFESLFAFEIHKVSTLILCCKRLIKTTKKDLSYRVLIIRQSKNWKYNRLKKDLSMMERLI